MNTTEKILIIKLGALGDIIMATGAIKAIRTKHPNAHISILTTKPYKDLLEKNPNIDSTIVDARKKPWNLGYLYKTYKNLQGWDYIYDLQNNSRTTGIYYRLAPKKTAWSGIAKGCKFQQPVENREKQHVVDMLNEQLRYAEITKFFEPDISYLSEDIEDLFSQKEINNLEQTAIIIPGCSAHRPMKRWPHYEELIHMLRAKNIQSILLGTSAESEILNKIQNETGAINLCNKTSIGQIVSLSNKALCVIGNDTGPLHIAAASNAKGIGIFGYASNPTRSAPRGKGMKTIKKEKIDAITPQEVLKELNL